MPWRPRKSHRRKGLPGATNKRRNGRVTYDRQHRKIRKRVLAQQPICNGWPAGNSCRLASTVADHVVPHNIAKRSAALELVHDLLGPEAVKEFEESLDWGRWLYRSRTNYQGLCHSCHGAKSRWEQQQFGKGKL